MATIILLVLLAFWLPGSWAWLLPITLLIDLGTAAGKK